MRIKYLLIGLISGALLATAGTTFAATTFEKITALIRSDISLKVSDKKIELKNAPLDYNGMSYLPVRDVAELLGREVKWDEASKTINLSCEGYFILGADGVMREYCP